MLRTYIDIRLCYKLVRALSLLSHSVSLVLKDFLFYRNDAFLTYGASCESVGFMSIVRIFEISVVQKPVQIYKTEVDEAVASVRI